MVTGYAVTNSDAKVKLGDLEKVATYSQSSMTVTFDEYPKPGSPVLEVQFKSSSNYLIGKTTTSTIAIPLALTLSSGVSTGF